MIRLIFFVFYIFFSTNLSAGVLEVCNYGPGNYLVKKHTDKAYPKKSVRNAPGGEYLECYVHKTSENKELYKELVKNLTKAGHSNNMVQKYTHKILDKTYRRILQSYNFEEEIDQTQLAKSSTGNENRKNYCVGYCKNQDFSIIKKEIIEKKKVKYNKKNKKINVFTDINSVAIDNTYCSIFNYSNSKLDPSKNQNANSFIFTSYDISACRPCPNKMNKNKENKTGFCSIPMFTYQVIYKNFIDYDFQKAMVYFFKQTEKAAKKNDLEFNIGRSSTNDIILNKINVKDYIHSELFILPISNKKDIIFIRQFIDNNKYWFYYIEEYKTTSRQQVKKISNMIMLNETDVFGFGHGKKMIKYIEDFISEIQSSYSQFFAKTSINKKEISNLYSLIPNKDKLSLFENELKIINNLNAFYEYHIQTRN